MKKTSKNTTMGMALGMCLGVAMGTAVFKNTALGMSLGMAVGIALGYAKDTQVNKQLEQVGYTVKSISHDKDGKEYSITIISKTGNETTVIVPKGVMAEESFEVGDAVFLTEKGGLEQAFDKDEE